MARLIPVHDLARQHDLDLTGGTHDPTGHPAYGADQQKIGTVRGAMAEPHTGRLRQLIVDVGSWFSSKEVLVPVGMARIEDDAVYFDNLTRAQVLDMREYRHGEDYEYDAQVSDERVLRGHDYRGEIGYHTPTRTTIASQSSHDEPRYNYRDEDEHDTLYTTPKRLRLLEERLVVNKERFIAGTVTVGKHVENHAEQVNVNLNHEEVVIERHPVSNPRPVEGHVTLGADTRTVHVDLEAERADVQKQAYVTEEVEVGKREVNETRTFTETVRREVLDVNQTGQAQIQGVDRTLDVDADRKGRRD